MASVNVSGFINKSFDWQTMVDQLITVDGTPKVKLQAAQTKNTDKITALADIKTAMIDFQSSVQALWDSNLYNARNVTSDTTNTSWKATSTSGATIGTYTLAVSKLATTAKLQGAENVAMLTGTTLGALNTATAVTAGNFTVNGKQITIGVDDSLDSVLTAISTATDGAVTASYDAGTDKMRFSSVSPMVLGAANDTSNFLSVMKLSNNITLSSGTYSVASSGTLGIIKANGPLGAVGPAIGSGTFKVNGVSIAYDASSDSLSDILKSINNSSAGVTASYSSATDRVILANSTTGDTGISVTDDTGGLLQALGLTTGAVFSAGSNAEFTVNDGPLQSNSSNSLDATALGISGLSVVVNSKTTQTINVTTDLSSANTAIQTFVDKYNALQSLINSKTAITTSGGTVTTAVLSDNREVEAWGSQIRAIAFGPITGATGVVKRLNDLGLDFSGSDGQLTIKDSAKLSSVLIDHPTDVAAFFQSGTTGLASKMYTYLTKVTKADSDTQNRLSVNNLQLDTQIADIQRRLDAEREQLTNAFLKMQDAQSQAQSQNTYLTNTFFKNNTSN